MQVQLIQIEELGYNFLRWNSTWGALTLLPRLESSRGGWPSILSYWVLEKRLAITHNTDNGYVY